MCYFYTPKKSESLRFSDIFNMYRKGALTYNGVRLQANIVGHLIQPVFYFYCPKTSETQNLLMFSGGMEGGHRLKMD